MIGLFILFRFINIKYEISILFDTINMIVLKHFFFFFGNVIYIYILYYIIYIFL